MVTRCVLCDTLSWRHICNHCLDRQLTPTIRKKDNVVSFYAYDDISPLLSYKYHPFGDKIIKILASRTFVPFAKAFKESAFVLPVDDTPKKGFSHTAILAKSLQTERIHPLFNSLKATAEVTYAGKSLEYRLKHPRNFIYTGKKDIEVILVDDVVTTKTTLNEAIEVLNESGIKVAFSLVLADKRL